MLIHSVVKLNFSRLSVCFHDAVLKWRHMTSHNVTFIDVIGLLDYVALNQNRNAVFISSPEPKAHKVSL